MELHCYSHHTLVESYQTKLERYPPMYQLVYVSEATRSLSNDELLEVLNVSRRNNPKVDVTGLLLYQNQQFVQVLEGPEAAVRETFERIKQDQRHQDVRIAIENEVTEREFGDWEMGLANVAFSDEGNIEGISDFMLDGVGTEEIFAYQSKVKTFLKMFQNLTRPV